jgi:hypothetical protein
VVSISADSCRVEGGTLASPALSRELPVAEDECQRERRCDKGVATHGRVLFRMKGEAGMPVLLYDDDHLALSTAVELAKKNSLPATE